MEALSRSGRTWNNILAQYKQGRFTQTILTICYIAFMLTIERYTGLFGGTGLQGGSLVLVSGSVKLVRVFLGIVTGFWSTFVLGGGVV